MFQQALENRLNKLKIFHSNAYKESLENHKLLNILLKHHLTKILKRFYGYARSENRKFSKIDSKWLKFKKG
jgi:hypothetical protein